jgi:hypothetical protein
LRRASEDPEQAEELMAGWCLGSEEFREELLAKMQRSKGPEHFGPEIRESAVEKAERLVKEEMARLGWRDSQLRQCRKGDREKVRIASRLRKETTMTLGWIAERLHMGTKTHLAHLLYWQGRKEQSL